MADVDGNGYPTDKALKRLRHWSMEDFAGALAFARTLWWHPNFGWSEYEAKDGRLYVLATGGWSGNESIIDALQDIGCGIMWAWVCEMSVKGGGYILKVSTEAMGHKAARAAKEE